MRRNVRRLNREVGGVVVTISGGKATALKQRDDDGHGTKKAANLSELKRYCKAAEEAAREVLLESQQADAFGLPDAQTSTTSDVQSLANIDENLPLKSPSRMVALQLANGNPTFRDKLKRKLEESGVHFEMEDAAGVFGSLGGAGNGRKGTKNGKPPLPAEDGKRSSKMRQKRKAPVAPEVDNSSIIRRRTKRELAISVQGTAAQIHTGMPIGANGTPFRSINMPLAGVQGYGTVSPLNVDKHVNWVGDDYYSNGLGSLGNLVGLPLGDTPGKGFLEGASSGQKDQGSSSSSSSDGTPRFDFDEVVQSFPSPRGTTGGSPSRWSLGSTGSSGVFSFLESRNKQPRNSLEGGVLDAKADAPSSSIERMANAAPAAPKTLEKEVVSTRDRRAAQRASSGSAGLPSPMSALPSPTLADLSASFLNNVDDQNTSPNVVSASDGSVSSNEVSSTRSSTSSNKSLK